MIELTAVSQNYLSKKEKPSSEMCNLDVFGIFVYWHVGLIHI